MSLAQTSVGYTRPDFSNVSIRGVHHKPHCQVVPSGLVIGQSICLKVRLRWLGAVLHYQCKLSVFLSSLNVPTIII